MASDAETRARELLGWAADDLDDLGWEISAQAMRKLLTDLDTARAAQQQVEQERDRLREALEEYGTHHNICGVYQWRKDNTCTCGLYKALAASRTPTEAK